MTDAELIRVCQAFCRTAAEIDRLTEIAETAGIALTDDGKDFRATVRPMVKANESDVARIVATPAKTIAGLAAKAAVYLAHLDDGVAKSMADDAIAIALAK